MGKMPVAHGVVQRFDSATPPDSTLERSVSTQRILTLDNGVG